MSSFSTELNLGNDTKYNVLNYNLKPIDLPRLFDIVVNSLFGTNTKTSSFKKFLLGFHRFLSYYQTPKLLVVRDRVIRRYIDDGFCTKSLSFINDIYVYVAILYRIRQIGIKNNINVSQLEEAIKDVFAGKNGDDGTGVLEDIDNSPNADSSCVYYVSVDADKKPISIDIAKFPEITTVMPSFSVFLKSVSVDDRLAFVNDYFHFNGSSEVRDEDFSDPECQTVLKSFAKQFQNKPVYDGPTFPNVSVCKLSLIFGKFIFENRVDFKSITTSDCKIPNCTKLGNLSYSEYITKCGQLFGKQFQDAIDLSKIDGANDREYFTKVFSIDVFRGILADYDLPFDKITSFNSKLIVDRAMYCYLLSLAMVYDNSV